MIATTKPSVRISTIILMILLFVLFETGEEAFKRMQMSSNKRCSAYLKKMKTAVNVKSTVKEINEAREELSEPAEDDQGPQLSAEATTAMKDVVEMCVKTDDSLPFEERVSMLNADKRRVFDSISNYLNHLKLHETNHFIHYLVV